MERNSLDRASDGSEWLHHDARIVVDEFIRLQPGEHVLLLTDAGRAAESEALHAAARTAGARVVSLDITDEVTAVVDGDAFWRDLPPMVVAAMQNANVTVATVDETYAFRLDHKVSSFLETNAGCSIFKVDLGMGEWRLDIDRIREVEQQGAAFVAAMRRADQVRVTSPAGTDITLSLRGRECLPVVIRPERGKPYGTPIPLWGEYNWAPVRGSVNGTVVVDGISEATAQIHVVDSPVRWTVEADRIVAVEGGAEADAFRRIFELDEGSGLIGELGIGGNPFAWLGNETEKARLGTVHFGVGQNAAYPGGDIRSSVHIDGGVRDAVIEVDGRVVVRDGRFVLEG